MNKLELFEKLETYGLGKHAQKIEASLRESIRLSLTPIKENTIVKIGTSKFGGKPDAPKNFEWPIEINKLPSSPNKTKTVERPLSFIAQINLSEITHLNQEGLFPTSGILYFFYSSEQTGWGFDPEDHSKFRVIYFDGDLSELNPLEYPEDLDKYGQFSPCTVNFDQEASLPGGFSDYYDFFSENEKDVFLNNIHNEDTIHKMLGYSNTIQNDMELECELVTNGIYCGDSSSHNSPKRTEIERNMSKWVLLLQVDTDDRCNMMWGDSGRLYFWIREEDLRNKRFEKSWFCLQCY